MGVDQLREFAVNTYPGWHFEREYRRRTSVPTRPSKRSNPSTPARNSGASGTVTGRGTVADRVLEFLDGSESEIPYTTVEDRLTDDVVDALRDAAARGVPICLGGVSPPVQARIQDRAPGAEKFESL